MKNLLAILVFLFPFATIAQEKESWTVSPEYLAMIKNCCLKDEVVPEAQIFGKLKTSRDKTFETLFRKRKLRIHATNTLHYREEVTIRAKRHLDGYFVGIGYESNRDPIKLLFEPIVESFFFENRPR